MRPYTKSWSSHWTWLFNELREVFSIPAAVIESAIPVIVLYLWKRYTCDGHRTFCLIKAAWPKICKKSVCVILSYYFSFKSKRHVVFNLQSVGQIKTRLNANTIYPGLLLIYCFILRVTLLSDKILEQGSIRQGTLEIANGEVIWSISYETIWRSLLMNVFKWHSKAWQ